MPQSQFGSGVLFGKPTAGNLATNPTPMTFGILQEVQATIKGDLKKLYGMQQGPVATARGKIDISVKGKFAALDPLVYSQLYFGVDTATGMRRPVYCEAGVAAAELTLTHPTATEDLGVINVSTGKQMPCSGSTAPGVGEYQFVAATNGTVPTTAKYVFNAADVTAELAVLKNYSWPDPIGTTLHINNQLMGTAPEIQALLYNKFKNSTFGLRLYACVMGQISIPTKQEDFWISDFDMEASSDISGNLLEIFSD